MARTRIPATRAPTTRDALAGWTVLVTRPAGQQASLRRALRAAGATPVTLPAFAIRAVDDPAAARRGLREASRAPVIIFTSPNAVRETWRLHPAWRPARNASVCAIGAATRRALARHGVDALSPARGSSSEALLAEAPLRAVRGKSVRIITAPGGRDVLASTLRARGADVERVDVYRRVPARWDARHERVMTALRTPLATLWSSSEALLAIRARMPAAAWRGVAAGVSIVAGERIAAAARGAAMKHVAVARSALARDLFAALIAVVAARRPRARG